MLMCNSKKKKKMGKKGRETKKKKLSVASFPCRRGGEKKKKSTFTAEATTHGKNKNVECIPPKKKIILPLLTIHFLLLFTSAHLLFR